MRILSLCFCAVLLGGCATTVPDVRPAAAYAEAARYSGRIAVHFVKADGEPESFNAKFDWQQGGGHTGIKLYSPLGDTVATLDVRPGLAVFEQAKHEPLTAPDVDSLTERALGWRLPVAGLAQWMQGRALDQTGKAWTASPAQDTVITKDGWRLRYVSWREGSAARPKRIDIERVTAVEAEKLSIKIVIDEDGDA